MADERIPGDRVVGRTKQGELTVDEIADLLPGFASLMDELARRYWTMYYAARAENWDLARYEWRESVKLFQKMAKTRPKYAEDLAAFERETFSRIGESLEHTDIAAFERAFQDGIAASDSYHDKWAKPYIRFRLPNRPPDFLDVSRD